MNKRPAIRLDDPGIHMACCGTNTWKAMQGSMTVFINSKPAVRMGDQTRHCGGIGAFIEGSQNVIIGGPPGMGSSGGGGGGGGGGGAGGGGGGGSGSSSQGSATGASARGSGGGGGGAGARSAPGSASSSPSAGTGAGGGATGEGQAASESTPKQDDEHVYVVATDLKTPGGQPLGFEQVVLVKKGTDETVAGPETTDDKGHVAFMVDEQGDYEIKIVEDEIDHPNTHIDESEVTFELHCQFLDDGVPVEGETVQITGPGTSQVVTLDATGQFALGVGPGEYELTIRKQTFKAHAVRAADFGGQHEFQLDNQLDKTADFEKARANRYSPANRGQS